MCVECRPLLVELRNSARGTQEIASGFFSYIEGICWMCNLGGQPSRTPFDNHSNSAGFTLALANYRGEPCDIEIRAKLENDEVGLSDDAMETPRNNLNRKITVGVTYSIDDITMCHQVVRKLNKVPKCSSETISTCCKYESKSLVGDPYQVKEKINCSFQL